VRQRRGFTLIELTIVLAVVVVAAGFMIVRLPGWSSKQALNASARALGNLIQSARERARAEERTYLLSLEGSGYTLAASPGDVIRKGRLTSGALFAHSGVLQLALTPLGLLPETRIGIRNSQGEKVEIVVRSLQNEVEYADAK
jgi:prepilin-type N-terminal cleavage/methylation domain-containing protein